MERITVDDCIDKVPNRFELLMLAAYRARTIAKGSHPAVEPDNDKPSVIALREIARGATGVNDLREAVIHSIQPGADVDQPETVAGQLPAPTDDGGQQPTESTEDELNKAMQRALPPDSSPRQEEPMQEPQASRPRMWSEASDFQGGDLIALAVSVAALKVTFVIVHYVPTALANAPGIPRASTIACLWSRRMLKIVLIAVAAVAFLTNDSVPATAADERSTPPLKGKAAFGDWQEDEPGVRRLLTLQDQPLAAKTPQNFAEVVPIPAGAKPRVPTGFSVEMVASGLAQPRVLRVAPNGDLFVADSVSNTVRVLRIPPGSAKPSNDQVFASGLYQPYGIAFYPLGPNPDWIYIANSDSVVRYPYKNGDLKAAGEAQTIVMRIPWVHHWTRDIVFTSDGQRMLLSVGSGSNVALDMFPVPFIKGGLEEWIKTRPLGATWDTEERRADVLSFNPDGTNEKIVATGLRNCSGITIQPATGRPWCVVNERDELGEDTPFEYATGVKEGAFYGWPWYYLGAHQDPRQKGKRPDLKDKVTVPDVLIQAHSAPLQIVFYEGEKFPSAYKGSAFVTLHGSWNRSRRTGYKVVRLLFDSAGNPTGEYEDFMTGFVVSDKQVWGRPVGIAAARDGSMFVSEDGNGTIWRITHQRTPAH